MNIYTDKYLKYKKKYLRLKYGGATNMDCPRRTFKKPFDQCLIERPYFKGYINKEYKESKTGRIGRDVECCKTRQCGNCKIYFYPSNIKKEDAKKKNIKN